MKLPIFAAMSRKRFVLTLVSVCLALSVLCGGVTYAWYALNKVVRDDGMKMYSYVSPNLLIAMSPEELQTLSTESDDPFVTEILPSGLAMVPATHFRDESDGTRTPSAGLWYLSNTSEVSLSTGLADTPIILPVPAVHAAHFYVDTEVYIAAAEVNIENATIEATMEIASKGEEDLKSYKATSIDFYVGEVSDSTYCGTLNAAGLDAAVNNANATCTSVKILDNDTLPSNHTSYIKVIMRFYFDGALLERTGQAYVFTEEASPDPLVMNVYFTATVDEATP